MTIPSVPVESMLLSAFTDHLGVETNNNSKVYQMSAGFRGHLESGATIKPPAKGGREVSRFRMPSLQVKLNLVTRVEENWLRELFPNDMSTGQHAVFDAPNKRR